MVKRLAHEDTSQTQARRGGRTAATELLASSPAPPGSDAEAQRVIALAAELVSMARRRESSADRATRLRLSRLVADPRGRRFTIAFADRFLRPARPRTAVRTVRELLAELGVPRFEFRWNRFLLGLLLRAGGIFPGFTFKRVRARFAAEIRRVTWPLSRPGLERRLKRARAAGFKVIVNLLGEHVVSDAEAAARLSGVAALASRRGVEAVSLKLSAIAAHLEAFTTEQRAPGIGDALEVLIRERLLPDGRLLMLDMEAYRDVGLTLRVLTDLSARPGLLQARIGVVVQAYLKDSAHVLEEVIAIAEARVRAGGPPLRVRLVKGANLAMERFEAASRGWPLATYDAKLDVDRSWRTLMTRALQAAERGFLEVGLASHNTFDLALGLLRWAHSAARERVGFELLAGIAPGTARALRDLGADVMLYAPVVADDDLLSAVAYLLRRFDESTSESNHLRHAFGMRARDAAFEAEAAFFRAGLLAGPPTTAAAALGRAHTSDVALPSGPPRGFRNAPDTDWTSPERRASVRDALERTLAASGWQVRPRVGGVDRDGEVRHGVDPSRPGVTLHEARMASSAVLDEALSIAKEKLARGTWLSPSAMRSRADVMDVVARRIGERREALIAAMVAETGKIVPEADVEVSEAIDFLHYYAECARAIAANEAVRPVALGVVVVASPWNFPFAIGVGGVAAALLAGNAVLFKPAPEAVLVGRLAAEALWDGGVPPDALQFVPCDNEPAGRHLVGHPDVAGVILTGGTATARRFQAWRPRLRLFAETGGKNAVIVTDAADRDLALRCIVQGAFGHAGQKCSATSVLICEDAVLEGGRFLERLREAAATLRVGSAWSPLTDIPPLIRPPRAPLSDALTELGPGERWLLEPRLDPDNPRLVSPGIRLGVAPGSAAHTVEFFGPHLAVMRAADLDAAIALANATPYGLTSGLQSLDPEEQRRWVSGMRAGNLYINRSTTGAIVGRQPFGGLKASAFGPGAKAGGPNYVAQFMHLEPRQATPASGLVQVPTAPASIAPQVPDYERCFSMRFAAPVQLTRIDGQSNVLRYLPVTCVLVRLGRGASAWDAERILTAIRVVGCHVHVSAAEPATWHAALGVPVRVEAPEVLAAEVAALDPAPERVRVSGFIADVLLTACLGAGMHVDDSPVAPDEASELLKYLREQSISHDWHRDGNLTLAPPGDLP
jgi:RHH-type proline utilization regulon transcriptional repressor/proline dehydrogenase/delta 1-pyrroline-5-carboxylate dehydrogenase